MLTEDEYFAIRDLHSHGPMINIGFSSDGREWFQVRMDLVRKGIWSDRYELTNKGRVCLRIYEVLNVLPSLDQT